MFRVRVRELREAAGYKSQQAFADTFGVAQTTVASWEGGKREPNYATTLRLADFFHVSLDYLLGRTEQKKIAPLEDGFTEPERDLISSYRRADEHTRAMVDLALEPYKALAHAKGAI